MKSYSYWKFCLDGIFPCSAGVSKTAFLFPLRKRGAKMRQRRRVKNQARRRFKYAGL